MLEKGTMTDYTLPLTLVFSLTFFLIQRSEAKARGCVTRVMVLMVGGAVLWFSYVRDVFGQVIWAIIVAGFLNLLFWLVIGRYNPPKSSDEIRVLKMDDE